MTYRNRVKKPNRHLKLPYWAKRLMVEDQEWFEQWCGKTGYKIGYMRRCGYTDTINPHTGKYHGWHEYGWKERGLKKRHRRAGKQLIASQLFDMELEIQDQIDEDDELIWEEYLMILQEEDMEMERQFQLQLQEEEDSAWDDEPYDPYLDFYDYDY